MPPLIGQCLEKHDWHSSYEQAAQCQIPPGGPATAPSAMSVLPQPPSHDTGFRAE